MNILKKFLLSLALLSTFVCHANTQTTKTIKCVDNNDQARLTYIKNDLSSTIDLGDKNLDCTMLEESENLLKCTAIDFETAGAFIFKLQDNSEGSLEILPPPGSGAIELIQLQCR